MLSDIGKKSLAQVHIESGQRVLVRVDFNVPLQAGRVTDDTRIVAALPTLKFLMERGAKIILVTHLGRPKGCVVDELRLDPVAERLSRYVGKTVRKVDEVVGPSARRAVDALLPGDLLLLENVRFHPGEEANDETFAADLADFAELYVNDAFGTAHRAHASTCGVARFLPAVAGFLMAEELRVLGALLERPQSPFWALLGGSKASDKLGILHSLMERCDGLVLGGVIANTFLAAKGIAVGASRVEEDLFPEALAILAEAERRGIPFLLPEDVVVADRFDASAQRRTVGADAIPDGWMVLDIGPRTVQNVQRALAGAGTIFWNGPMGVFEWDPFAAGTLAVAKAVASSPAWSVIGGGESAAAAHKAGVAEHIGHISTGGGASLEFLEGRELPGVAALMDADSVASGGHGRH